MAQTSLPERTAMTERIAQLGRRRRHADIDDAVYAAMYFLCWQMALHGRSCAARKYRHDPRPDPAAWWEQLRGMAGEDARDRLLYYLQRYGFLKVIANVPAALCAWLRGQWPLVLCEYIPEPERVLAMQACGTRPVTVLTGFPRMLRPVLNKANAYAFMVHDLEHAYKYFHDPGLHREQRRFFAVMDGLMRQGAFDEYRRDPCFAERFTYLISDMNTHVMHSMQFLRAILIEYHLRRERKPPGGMLSTAVRQQVDALMERLQGLVDADGGGQTSRQPPATVVVR